MSVDYRAGVARGFKISKEVFQKADEDFKNKYANEYVSSLSEGLYEMNCLISLNGYSNEGDYILGYNIVDDTESRGEYFEDYEDILRDAKISALYAKFFAAPGETDFTPKKIVYLQVY